MGAYKHMSWKLTMVFGSWCTAQTLSPLWNDCRCHWQFPEASNSYALPQVHQAEEWNTRLSLPRRQASLCTLAVLGPFAYIYIDHETPVNTIRLTSTLPWPEVRWQRLEANWRIYQAFCQKGRQRVLQLDGRSLGCRLHLYYIGKHTRTILTHYWKIHRLPRLEKRKRLRMLTLRGWTH